MQHKLQKGFTLLELSITTVLMTMGIVAMIQMQGYQAQLEVARSIAQIYQRINNAAGGYLVNYYDVLKDVPSDCSNTGLRGATVVNAPAGPPLAGCNRTFGQVNVANALQPTLDELRQLGLLNGADGAQLNNVLPLPTFAVAQGNRFQMLDADGKVAEAAFGILIEKIQVAGAQDLRSLVYNRQPFNLEGTSRAGGVLLDEMLMAAGGDAYMSDNQPGSEGQLRAQAGAAEANMPNPMQVAGPNGSVLGAPYVFAMRNGYGSAGFDRYVRRDGSTPLTGNWNVGGKDITGVNRLDAQSGKFANDITAGGTITGTTINGTEGYFKGNVKADGTITAATVNGTTVNGTTVNGTTVNGTTVNGKDGNFTGNFITNAFQAVSAYISGALTVAGDALFKGNLKVEKDGVFGGALTANGALNANGSLTVNGRTELNGDSTNVANLRLQQEAELGKGCNPDVETLRKARSPANEPALKLLVCDPQSRVWVRAQADYAGEIAGINSSITGINTNINGINTNIDGIYTNINGINSTISSLSSGLNQQISNLGSSLNQQISGLTDRVTKLETDMKVVQSGYTDLSLILNGNGSTEKPGLVNVVSDMKKNEMRWDIVNVTWAPATCDPSSTIITTNGTIPVCTAQTRVWKKTPWRCNDLGNTSQYLSSAFGGFDEVRWLQYASDNVSTLDNASSTPPILLGLDNAPNEPVVYDVNCRAPNAKDPGGDNYWYIGMSATQSNRKNGNMCRSGLGSILDNSGSIMTTYDGGTYANASCKNFAISAPSFNRSVMSARFIAFSRKK